VEYRQLNKQTIPTIYPIPKIHDYLQQLSGSKVFSQIDLNLGYYQISMKPEDIHKTSFMICNQQYEFLRMPFGLANAPRTFQRAMNNLFYDYDFVKVYLNEILVHSTSIEKHYEDLKRVFEKLKEINASINFEKSNFNVKTVCYLGSIISEDGIKADISRFWKYERLVPKTKKTNTAYLRFSQLV
jgi:hypothetical protein